MKSTMQGVKNIFSIVIITNLLFSWCSFVGAWRATNVRLPAFASINRLRPEDQVFHYKKNINDQEDFVKVPSLKSSRFKIRKRNRRKSGDPLLTPDEEGEDYWKNGEPLDVQNVAGARRIKKKGFLKRKSKFRRVSYDSDENLYGLPLRKPEIPKEPKQKRNLSSSKKDTIKAVVTDVHEMRNAVLDRGNELKYIQFQNVSFLASENVTKVHEEFDPFNHEVLKLIKMRARMNSKPGERAPGDNATLALSIEGGGMRGAVSAGMASAIAVLGLSDAFDSIYGSSAGSVVGAYLVSRQMCIDVYTDVLTTAKTKFVSKGRLASTLASNLIDYKVLRNSTVLSKFIDPAMNISYVLDDIMCPDNGLRALDYETFTINDERQNLRICTSTVRDGKLETHCMGSRTMDFFDKVDEETGEVLERATTMLSNDRHGFFACLETSMLVPTATGPPRTLLRHKDAGTDIGTHCFDAFCFEPIPYRSAVAEGATHVLALKSKPDGVSIPTKPGLFETTFAPIYFNTNGFPEVATYFENGGQQYVYTEDYLTLDEGKSHTIDDHKDGVLIPPQKILYGIEQDDEAKMLASNRDGWKRAHLLPIAVPAGKPELSNVSVDEDEVLEAVRLGFASAFDLLAPFANIGDIGLGEHLDGERVAELLFSHSGTYDKVLEEPEPVQGFYIEETENLCATESEKIDFQCTDSKIDTDGNEICPRRDASDLLDALPGLRDGKMTSLSKGLRKLKNGETKRC